MCLLGMNGMDVRGWGKYAVNGEQKEGSSIYGGSRLEIEENTYTVTIYLGFSKTASISNILTYSLHNSCHF